MATLALLPLSACLPEFAGVPPSAPSAGDITVSALPELGAADADGAEPDLALSGTLEDVPGPAPGDNGEAAAPTVATGEDLSPPEGPETAAAAPLPEPSTVFGRSVLAAERTRCERAGGSLAPRGRSDVLSCFITPRDAGRSCSSSGDCQGSCLARSRTCAPLIPLLGCHEVLLANGARVTECLD